MTTEFTAAPSHIAVVLRNTGTHASPTWVSWTGCRDVSTHSRKRDTYEVGNRALTSKGYIRGRLDHDLTIQAPELYGDANWLAANDAFNAADNDDAATIYLATLSGPIATIGTTGIKGYYIIEEMSEPFPIDGVMMTEFKLKPAARAPGLTNVKITS